MNNPLRSLAFALHLIPLCLAAQPASQKSMSDQRTWTAPLTIAAHPDDRAPTTDADCMPPQDLATRYLFIVTTDGLRWREVFGGADSVLLFDPATRALDTAGAAGRFWAPDLEARRHALMPFLWTTLAGEGQLYGNRLYGNCVDVSNRWAVSYPGYNELLTGRPDNWRICTNLKLRNPNRNVLEFFQNQDCLKNEVVAFASWSAFPFILNARRSKLPVNSGKVNRRLCHRGPKPPKESKLDDPYTWHAATDYVREHHPAVVYIGLNATDLLAHRGDYGAYLEAAHRLDRYLAELWTFIQNDPVYRQRTTLLISTDHGRGAGSIARWSNHNRRIDGSSEIWLAAIGPDTTPLGEVRAPMQLWQKQFAQTAAHLLGLEFRRGRKVAPPVAAIFADPDRSRWSFREQDADK
jgi:hypothetical protein